MRNPTLALDNEVARIVEDFLSPLTIGQTVTLDYLKRDGSESSAAGTILEIGGTIGFDNRFLKIATERGPRTINIHLIKGI